MKLVKYIDSESERQYSRYICVKDGRGFWTDGFKILEQKTWLEDGVYDQGLFAVSDFKYPDVLSVLPTSEPVPVKSDRICDLVHFFWSLAPGLIGVDPSGNVIIVAHADSVPSDYMLFDLDTIHLISDISMDSESSGYDLKVNLYPAEDRINISLTCGEISMYLGEVECIEEGSVD